MHKDSIKKNNSNQIEITQGKPLPACIPQKVSRLVYILLLNFEVILHEKYIISCKNYVTYVTDPPTDRQTNLPIETPTRSLKIQNSLDFVYYTKIHTIG